MSRTGAIKLFFFCHTVVRFYSFFFKEERVVSGRVAKKKEEDREGAELASKEDRR